MVDNKNGFITRLKRLFVREKTEADNSNRNADFNVMKEKAESLKEANNHDKVQSYNGIIVDSNSPIWNKYFSGVQEIYRKHTPLGVLRTNGREIEIEHFDLSHFELLKQFCIIPLFKSATDHSIIGYYEINIATARIANVYTLAEGGKEIVRGTLRAKISKSAFDGEISQQYFTKIDSFIAALEEMCAKK